MKLKNIKKTTCINFDKNELLILFEALSKINEKNLDFLNKAENQILWDMECELEAFLPEIFDSNYENLIKNAEKDFLGNKKK